MAEQMSQDINRAPDFQPSAGSLVNSDRLMPWVWVFLYSAVLASLSAVRYQSWFATGWDLGLYEQGLWAIWHHGLLAHSSLTGLPMVAESGSLILWPLALLYHFGGTGFLFVLQALGFGLGYLGIVRIGEDFGVAPRTRHVIGLIYLIYPVLLAANVDDFHPVTLAVPLIFAAVHLAMTRRYVLYAVTLVGVLAVNDLAALAVIGVGFGLMFWCPDGRRVAGFLTALAAVVWLILITGYIMPGWTHQSFWLTYYHTLGPTAHAASTAVSKRPWLLFEWVRSTRSLEYLGYIVGPVIGLVLFKARWQAWVWLLGMVLIVELNGLSGTAATTSPFDQYSVLAIPALFITLLAMAQKVEWKTGWRYRWRGLIAVVFLVVTVYHLHETTWRAAPPNAKELAEAAVLVPSRAPVIAQNFIMPEFANRQVLLDTNQWGSVALAKGTYVMLDSEFTTENTAPGLLARWTPVLVKNQKVLYADKGVILIKIVRRVAKGAAHA